LTKWVVYVISFEDGSDYAGYTLDLKTRLKHHQSRTMSCNRILYEKLHTETNWICEVVSEHADRLDAVKAESALIQKLTNPINIIKPVINHSIEPSYKLQYERRTRKRNYPRRERNQTCRICKRNLEHSEFWSDRSRSCGLSSKCKVCSNSFRRFHNFLGDNWNETTNQKWRRSRERWGKEQGI